jgi:hypothetical protein
MPPPHLPPFLKNKIYKTGMTRGADDDEIYQNRVGRCSTVLIPFEQWGTASIPPKGEAQFQAGFIALVTPRDYFEGDAQRRMAKAGLVLGQNAVVFYEMRSDWLNFPPARQGWTAANSRSNPLGGQYVSRVAATTANADGAKINHGYAARPKGAGIRAYEYASSQTIVDCRTQLEAVFWRCEDASDVAHEAGMSLADVQERREFNTAAANERALLDVNRLGKSRILDGAGVAICPLCLSALSAKEFLSRIEQAEGRAVHDQTVTQVNLFHIEELRFGRYGHRAYNIGWGHHHCNVVVKDSGIDATLMWMSDVVGRNVTAGYLTANKGPSPAGT